MNRMRLENESRLLKRVALHRQEYRESRTAVVSEERERRHADGELYFAGCWVPRAEAGRLAHGFQRKERFTFIEIVILLAVLLGLAQGLCWLFALLFLP